MEKSTIGTAYLSNHYRPKLFKPIFLPYISSLLYRQIIMLPISWNLIDLIRSSNTRRGQNSDEILTKYWFLGRNELLSYIFIFTNTLGIIHYYYGTKWSSYLNEIYFYFYHFVGLVTFAHNFLPFTDLPTASLSKVYSDYWDVSNYVFFVNFVWCYVLENPLYKKFNIGKMIWFYGFMMLFVTRLGSVTATEKTTDASYRNMMLSVGGFLAHLLAYSINTLVIFLSSTCRSEARKTELETYAKDLEDFETYFIKTFMDDENVNYQKAKLMFNFRDYDDYHEMRAVIWTKPLRWINPITAVLMAAAYVGTITYSTYDHFN
jgi:hypothetical protein